MNTDASTDRFLLALGGFIGFGGAFLTAIKMGGEDISSALLRASVGMIVGALLMKMLLSSAHSLFKQAKIEQLRKNITRVPEPEEPNNAKSPKG
ncbi:MAG: hypothetical protein WC360_01955 [Opitutales bacterium]|jgi:hypothetical protein